ncbi:MAG TPA: PDZ domain-containing protein [Pirellulales bacterium]|jgi:predicted metalloprotease with PDZ domain
MKSSNSLWDCFANLHRVSLAFSLLCFFTFGSISASQADDSKPIEFQVDAREAPRRLLHAQLNIPAKPGAMILSYPKWIPGEHAPDGPIADLAGLKIKAGDKTIPWRRDDVNMYDFHVTVPEGAESIDVSLDYLLPSSVSRGTYSGLPSTPNLALIHWYTLLLYPNGKPAREIPFRTKLTLPEGWKAGTALPVESESGATTKYQTVSLETLADSPALCGRFFKEIPLGVQSGAPHSLVVAADSGEALNASPEVIAEYQRLVAEAQSLFGARHYKSYRFLMALSDTLPHNAVEHHESSDNRLAERFFLDDKYRKQSSAWVLAHEYVHSWNGKYRRPEGLATPDYQQPMRTELLWVYEGLTQYYGFVLAARSGLLAPDLAIENIASVADWAKNRSGRDWRPLADTAISAPFLYGSREDWSARRRGVDFYNEGALIWLDADTLIREQTDGKKSLDDFCKAFYGNGDGPPEVKPYRLDDIVAALNGVTPYDWRGFLDRRLNTAGADAPLEGIARSGWNLVYRDKPGELTKARDDEAKSLDLRSSLGIGIRDDGAVTDVLPGTPADKAGIAPGMKLLAVNGRRLTLERLKQIVAGTKEGGAAAKLTIIAENGDYFQTISLNYSDGLRYPALERIADKPDRLSEIFKAHVGQSK